MGRMGKGAWGWEVAHAGQNWRLVRLSESRGPVLFYSSFRGFRLHTKIVDEEEIWGLPGKEVVKKGNEIQDWRDGGDSGPCTCITSHAFGLNNHFLESPILDLDCKIYSVVEGLVPSILSSYFDPCFSSLCTANNHHRTKFFERLEK